MRPLTWICLALAWGAGACGSNDHPPPFQGNLGTGGSPSDGGIDVDPGDATVGICGQDIIPAVENPPNLYFVVDRSGSMDEPFEDTGISKYQTARTLIGNVLRQIGHRVRYGAAVFPAMVNGDGCEPGDQIFPTTQGDSPSYARAGQTGPILLDLLSRLGSTDGGGGTPTAATLAALRPTIAGLGPRTYVVLATDGAPNCNEELSCSADTCMLNIEGVSVDGVACDGSFNCCDPANTAAGANAWCVDSDALEAEVGALSELGVTTFVIGMPGAGVYADLLDRLAELGDTAQDGPTEYFAANDTQSLSDALFSIGTGVAISCNIELEREPEDAAQVNVYFDERLVELDAENGWDWTGTQSVELRGAACDELSSGNVLEVQIVYGCPTVVK